MCLSETNLKPREALEETAHLENDLGKLSNFYGKKKRIRLL